MSVMVIQQFSLRRYKCPINIQRSKSYCPLSLPPTPLRVSRAKKYQENFKDQGNLSVRRGVFSEL